MPSLRHELLGWAVPRLRRSRDLDPPERERERLLRWQATLEPGLPDAWVPGLGRRATVTTETLTGPAGDSPA